MIYFITKNTWTKTKRNSANKIAYDNDRRLSFKWRQAARSNIKQKILCLFSKWQRNFYFAFRLFFSAGTTSNLFTFLLLLTFQFISLPSLSWLNVVLCLESDVLITLKLFFKKEDLKKLALLPLRQWKLRWSCSFSSRTFSPPFSWLSTRGRGASSWPLLSACASSSAVKRGWCYPPCKLASATLQTLHKPHSLRCCEKTRMKFNKSNLYKFFKTKTFSQSYFLNQ